MPAIDAVLIVIAGIGAGAINSIVGSGTLITFPTLVFLGLPPLAANVSNNVGLVAGGFSASWGYRRELRGTSPLLRQLLPLSIVGSLIGAALLLVLPPAAFRAVVPVLITLALVLVLVGPRLQAQVAKGAAAQGSMPSWHRPALRAGVLLGGMYGGYFGAAQGVLLMGLFSALSAESLQRLTGFKNVLVTSVNLVAAAAFIIFAREHINWVAAALVAIGSLIGGLLGARIGRRLPPVALRAVIVLVGLIAIAKMVWWS